MKNNSPKISVILPAYNAEKYLSKSVESILHQSFTNFELIIINDCSSDQTEKIIKRFAKSDNRIILVNNKTNLKLAKSLNLGIKIARGKYIARMDADDWSYPYRLEKQYEYLEKNPDVGIVGGAMDVCDEKLEKTNTRKYFEKDSDIRKRIFFYSPFSHPLIMMRTSVIKKIGMYDPSYNPAEDYELYFRIGKVSKLANLSETLLKYRVVPNSMTTARSSKMERMTLRIRYEHFGDYHARFVDKLYYYLELISIFFIPYNFKISLFNLVRTYYR